MLPNSVIFRRWSCSFSGPEFWALAEDASD